ncbi:hypothetical protein Drorol1_Dr00012038 [Drosera rotundifolia]
MRDAPTDKHNSSRSEAIMEICKVDSSIGEELNDVAEPSPVEPLQASSLAALFCSSVSFGLQLGPWAASCGTWVRPVRKREKEFAGPV